MVVHYSSSPGFVSTLYLSEYGFESHTYRANLASCVSFSISKTMI